jgi:hypothetical protein
MANAYNPFTSAVESVTKVGRTEPFDLQVARNQIMGHQEVNIFGYQSAVTTTQYAVWENVADYTYPSSAVTMTLAGSAGDTASILISGLDANYSQISEILVLNGATGVTSVNQYFRINNMSVVTGSATNPSGAVTLTNGGVTYAKINASVGSSQMSIYTVPAGYTYFITRIDGFTSFNGNNVNYINYRNKNVSPTGVVSYRAQSPFTQQYHIQRVMPLQFSEKTDIQFQLGTSTGTAVVSIFVEGYLIKNDGQSA